MCRNVEGEVIAGRKKMRIMNAADEKGITVPIRVVVHQMLKVP